MPLKILNVEVLTEEQSVILKRNARRERREKRDRFERMTPADVVGLLLRDISAMQSGRAGNYPMTEWLLPPALNEQISKSDDPRVGLLWYVLDTRSPVLVEFSSPPSKKFEGDLRSLAKRMDLMLHFSRLIDSLIVVNVHRRSPTKKTMPVESVIYL